MQPGWRLYHTLQEGDTIDRYIQDAEQAGDNELKKYFQNVKEADEERAQQAKNLLKQRLS